MRAYGAFLLFAALATSACSEDEPAARRDTSGAEVIVSVSPESVTVAPGSDTRFSAEVSNSTDASVVWSVEEANGGTIDALGLYTAPVTEGIYHVIATSVADAEVSARATVTVSADVPLDVTISISPTSASVEAGKAATFTATVAGAGDKSVTWSVVEAGGGTITAAGVYTAPWITGKYKVKATSNADPAKSATATVTVTPSTSGGSGISVSVSPVAVQVDTGSQTTFTATVNGTTNTAVNWSVVEAGGGTITSGGVYTAPSAPGTFTVKATSQADPAKSATAEVTVVVPVGGVTLTPLTATIEQGGTVQFTATVEGGGQIDWYVQEVGGGNIGGNGKYTAPMANGIYHVVAENRSDATKFAVATVTVVAPTIDITISPESADVEIGGNLLITASITSVHNGYTLSLQETSGCGAINNTTGIYTAPMIETVCHVVATSTFDPTKTAVATINVHGPKLYPSITPGFASVEPGMAVLFSGDLTGSTLYGSWHYEVSDGYITLGGLYYPPTSNGLYSVYVVSDYNSDVSEAATVEVRDPILYPSVVPEAVTLEKGQGFTFAGMITGTAYDTFTWSLPVPDSGTIDLNGNYNAPVTPGTYFVVLVADYDNDVTAYSTVTVVAPTIYVSVYPTQTTMFTSSTYQFSAEITGTIYTAYTWEVVGPDAGLIDGSGLYTSPSTEGTYEVRAVSVEDPSIYASAFVTVVAPYCPTGSRQIDVKTDPGQDTWWDTQDDVQTSIVRVLYGPATTYVTILRLDEVEADGFPFYPYNATAVIVYSGAGDDGFFGTGDDEISSYYALHYDVSGLQTGYSIMDPGPDQAYGTNDDIPMGGKLVEWNGGYQANVYTYIELGLEGYDVANGEVTGREYYSLSDFAMWNCAFCTRRVPAQISSYSGPGADLVWAGFAGDTDGDEYAGQQQIQWDNYYYLGYFYGNQYRYNGFPNDVYDYNQRGSYQYRSDWSQDRWWDGVEYRYEPYWVNNYRYKGNGDQMFDGRYRFYWGSDKEIPTRVDFEDKQYRRIARADQKVCP